MATYIMLMKFINPGVDSIKGASAGRAAGKRAAKALGITWKQQYLVMGEYDIITVVDAPNDEVVAKFALMGMTGTLAITTMRAFTESEADKLIKELQPPSD
ncbi:MAG: GYD domain-containing protein [Actinomycetota bacterium]|nr:GYD domain-containing protein [Actinomycetota bacterium]